MFTANIRKRTKHTCHIFITCKIFTYTMVCLKTTTGPHHMHIAQKCQGSEPKFTLRFTCKLNFDISRNIRIFSNHISLTFMRPKVQLYHGFSFLTRSILLSQHCLLLCINTYTALYTFLTNLVLSVNYSVYSFDVFSLRTGFYLFR